MASPPTRVGTLLADLAQGLTGLGLRWYLFGAQAAIVHGASRLTADVDVTIDLGRLPAARLIASLKPLGFVPQIPDPSFIEVTRVIPMLHRKTALPVDLVLAGPGLEDLFFERRCRVKIGRAWINVAAPEDLIVMKLLSGRAKDIDDVSTLLEVRAADLDVATIRETLGLAEALLDQSDLLPTFDRLHEPTEIGGRRRARKSRAGSRRPRASAKSTKKA